MFFSSMFLLFSLIAKNLLASFEAQPEYKRSPWFSAALEKFQAW